MADSTSVSSALATLGVNGWVPTNDPRYAGMANLWQSTWANRPLTGTIAVGQQLLVTDVGLAPGSMFVWDGTRWRPANGLALLAQLATPTILPSSGSSNASGLITMTTAIGYTLGSGQACAIYLPAGVVTAGSQGSGAGVYQATGLGTNNTVQISGTGIVTANGAYTQTTASALNLTSVSVPASLMGVNGSLRARSVLSAPNGTGTKTPSLAFGGSQFRNLTMGPTAISGGMVGVLHNRGSQAVQIAPDQYDSQTEGAFATNAVVRLAIDTSAAQTLAFQGTLTNAADYLILESYTVELLA